MQVHDLSCGKHTPAGRVIGEMFYRGFLDAVLHRDEYSGRPNDGTMNKLRLKLEPSDFDAFLKLVPDFSAQFEGSYWPERFRQFSERAELLQMGADAPIMEVLEYFREGTNWDWAMRELARVQDGLEREGKPFQTLGDMSKYTSSEIAGPQCRYCGNKTQSWMGWAMHKFGLKHKLVGC